LFIRSRLAILYPVQNQPLLILVLLLRLIRTQLGDVQEDSHVYTGYTFVYDRMGSDSHFQTLFNSMNHRQFTAALEGLTPRRRQVLKLLLAGASDRAIAQSLVIAQATVRKHVEKICLDFGIKNEFPDERRSKRPELMALFMRYKPEWVGQRLETATVQSVMHGASRPGEKRSSLGSVALSDRRVDETAEEAFLYNRDVFILIDQSGSMVRKDEDTGKQSRYEYLAEVVEGHVAAILGKRQYSGNESSRRICDRIHLYFFSPKKRIPRPILIQDASQIWTLFVEHQPKTKTFISPTLDHCMTTWLSQKKSDCQGAFFIIYTDGQFDDEERFVKIMASACDKVRDRKEVQFIVLGLGQDIDIEHFLALDFNINQTMPFNIFVFDRVNEVHDIIELLSRQLTDEPHLAFPAWVRDDYPELFKKLQAAVR